MGSPQSQRGPSVRVIRVHERGRLLQDAGVLHLQEGDRSQSSIITCIYLYLYIIKFT